MEIKNTVSQICFRINVLSILFCIILSCRTAKEKSELLHMNTKAQSQSNAYTSWMQFDRQDSNHRYWHFRTDGAFYFHPDSGLYARNGVLSFWEEEVKKKERLSWQDSSHQRTSESIDTHFLSYNLKKVSQQRWVPIIWILLILACGYYFYSKIRLRK